MGCPALLTVIEKAGMVDRVRVINRHFLKKRFIPFKNLSEAESLAPFFSIQKNKALSYMRADKKLSVYNTIYQSLNKFPRPYLDFFIEWGGKLELVKGSVTNHPQLQNWKGQRPRGYAKGITFEQMTAVAEGLGIYITPEEVLVNTKNGSTNTILHEYGHVLDYLFAWATGSKYLSSSKKFRTTSKVNRWHDPFFDKSPSEAFAEGVARYLENSETREKLKAELPELYKYISKMFSRAPATWVRVLNKK